MTTKQFKIKLEELKQKVEQESKDLDLTTWEHKLCIVRTGEAPDDSCSYNNEGCLNQAAWMGENAAILIAEIHKLRSQRAILAALTERAMQHIIHKHARPFLATWLKDAERDLHHCTKGINL